MRSMFPGQFRLNDDGFAALWSNCIFAVDANVLLNLYRYWLYYCAPRLKIAALEIGRLNG